MGSGYAGSVVAHNAVLKAWKTRRKIAATPDSMYIDESHHGGGTLRLKKVTGTLAYGVPVTHNAALKAHETRRANAKKRSNTAKKAWATRRK